MVVELTHREIMNILKKAYKEGFKMDPTQTENLDGRAETESQKILMWLLTQDDYKMHQT